MKFSNTGLILAGMLTGATFAAENFDDALKRAAGDYAVRLQQAGEALNQARERVAAEKAPLLKALRVTEDEIIALERETLRLTTDKENAGSDKRRLLRDIEEQRKTTAYVSTLAGDAIKAVANGLPPGEEALVGDRLRELQQAHDAANTSGTGAASSMAIAEFLLDRAERLLGGQLAPAQAINAQDNRLVPGTIALVGPEVFFAPAAGGPAGVVRVRAGSIQPIYYPQAQWKAEESSAFFSSRIGAFPADPTGGKALRLQQSSGTLAEHIEKGGKVAWAIIVVGLVAVLLAGHKIYDVVMMRVDLSSRVTVFLRAVAAGNRREAKAALGSLGASTREIFAEGLRHLDSPTNILEEKLEAVLLGQRLHFERRLPLLAVIATAAPLMGLLGTVVGMVKTFTLITVFGTGNAAKLSSGISEVLVATELGLAVAIPALVVHGFLSHRINKNLAVLERQALEFVTAVATAQSGITPAEERT